MELNEKGAYVSISEFNKLKVELVWTSPVDLDLMVFYKTREGLVGGVFSDHYEGGSLGDLEHAPWIELSGDAGVGASDGEKREVLHIARMDSFEQLCVCALNFTDASADSRGVFANYDAHVKVTTDQGEAFRVNLASDEPGSVAMICKLLPTFLGSDLVNTSEVMTVERLRQVAPGAEELELVKI